MSVSTATVIPHIAERKTLSGRFRQSSQPINLIPGKICFEVRIKQGGGQIGQLKIGGVEVGAIFLIFFASHNTLVNITLSLIAFGDRIPVLFRLLDSVLLHKGVY